jgi:hypothetical protein
MELRWEIWPVVSFRPIQYRPVVTGSRPFGDHFVRWTFDGKVAEATAALMGEATQEAADR